MVYCQEEDKSLKFLSCFPPLDPVENQKADILACTTVFNPQSLPRPITMKAYSSYCEEVYSTGRGPELCGVITADYDLFDKMECEIDIEGNAEKVVG